MRRYTNTERRNGELAVRHLSNKAWRCYSDTEPLAVYEVQTDDGFRYDVTGVLEATGLTLDQLGKLLEDYQDALDELDENPFDEEADA